MADSAEGKYTLKKAPKRDLYLTVAGAVLFLLAYLGADTEGLDKTMLAEAIGMMVALYGVASRIDWLRRLKDPKDAGDE